MDFKQQNDSEREFYKQDFSSVNELLKRIRISLSTNKDINIQDLDFKNIIEFSPLNTLVYITLFQGGLKSIRYGSKRETLESTIRRNIEVLKTNKDFDKFNISDENKCRILIEYVTERHRVNPRDLQVTNFNENRYEPGITGLELKKGNQSWYYTPTDAIKLSHMSLKMASNAVLRQSPIGKMTDKISERIKILLQSQEYEEYLFKTRAFVTFKDKVLPLYRGNTLYKEFDYDILKDQIIKSANWLVENMHSDGRFLYYYDCCEDNFKDHEHPTRKENNLYYNDLRHSGGVVALIRAYELTNDDKYIESAQRALDWSITTLKSHDTKFGKALYSYYNRKGKLGGSGLMLIALMQYRIFTKDTVYDEFIKGLVRHLISRVTDEGEFLGYYIHPEYQNGKPLIKMSDSERKETFSFYYPGEALLGLALFVNNFDDEIIPTVKEICMKALNWIVDERPKHYADLFTALPSDAWLMQAIEEWTKIKEFAKDNLINFVFNDANTMIEKQYKRDDSPYIDYEGGYYYNYGDHYYPDGARSEGLVAAYWLSKRLGKDKLAKHFLEGCKKAALSQFSLFNTEEYTYAHKNPERSKYCIRFKMTRQWVRVDTIQHVLCFFARLYKAK